MNSNYIDLQKDLQRFESAVCDAWSYDTKLEYTEGYVSSGQLKKSEAKHDLVRTIKSEILEKIAAITNGEG